MLMNFGATNFLSFQKEMNSLLFSGSETHPSRFACLTAGAGSGMRLLLRVGILRLDDSTIRELRKDGFDLAEARYRELKPILDELALLEAEQKAEEAEGPETSAKKRGKKKTRN
ncbi:hypothetical protein V8G54_005766 [Vigna mungo]|uniref:DUF4110 domain-containing protein n=1 Tax=Vigna mungo TaxID=3915 RepID=A0AAQ3S3Z7_VIGMU